MYEIVFTFKLTTEKGNIPNPRKKVQKDETSKPREFKHPHQPFFETKINQTPVLQFNV